MTDRRDVRGPWIVDAHVHVHPCFDTVAFFDAAADHLARAAHAAGASDARFALLLTESAGDTFFRDRAPTADDDREERVRGWKIRASAEPDSWVAVRRDRTSIHVIAGRQIVTAEGLEVLALCRDVDIPDGAAIRDVVAAAREAGAVPVVPWGFGKWWFGRGRTVASLVADETAGRFFLGDNGGRPAWSNRPAAFALAEGRGIRVLPGSDPLPFRRHARRPGSYGFVLDRALDVDRPAAGFREALADPATRLSPFGRGRSLVAFARDQIAMQLVKRGRSGARASEDGHEAHP